ncbi:hypothetical protein AI27_05125 [Sphingomonas sp. BHC-A]|nr:hypothetical protein AI27_05125 [Sphingomonas sp. BHC-A]
MIAVEPFHPADLEEIAVQPAQAGLLPRSERRWFADRAHDLGPAWSARDREGRLILCAGFLVAHAGAATAWCVMAEAKGMALLAITRRIRALMAAASWRRVEMLTDPDFPEAGEWARLLGFTLEGVRRASAADGGDELCWVRIRSDK